MFMALMTTQLQVLKTDITVTRAGVSYQGQTLLPWWDARDHMTLTAFYNQPAVPAVKLWKPQSPVSDFNRSSVMSEFTALAKLEGLIYPAPVALPLDMPGAFHFTDPVFPHAFNTACQLYRK
jgi:hypothetical protein